MGRRAVQVLVDRIDARRRDGPTAEAQNIVLPTQVIPGGTLAPRRQTLLTIG
jgi:DNA-binding LacI/PurR family transcriptional regulator